MHRTIHVFVDESGDLGFSPSSSRHIVAVALAVPDSVAVRRLVRRAHGRFGPRENRPGELKFNTGSAGLKRFILEGMARTDVRVAWSAVFKPGPVAELR